MYSKVLAFIDNHFEMDKLYMGYRKTDCLKEGELCKFCTGVPWILDPISGLPRPYPSENGNYLSYDETPIEGRQPDDF